MTIPFALIPSFKIIWRAIFNRPTDGSTWSKNLPSESVTFYSRGTFALQKAIEDILDKKTEQNSRIWLPDYFCREPLAPLRNKQWHLYFYPIKKDLNPDWERITGSATIAYGLDIFVLVNYFGFTGQREMAKKICQQYNATLIEDCAHQILPDGRVENTMIFSPRKFFAIPDGGILLKPNDNRQKTNLNKDYKLIFQWLSLRWSQKIMLFFHIPWHRIRLLFRKGETAKIDWNICRANILPNFFTLKLLAVIEKDLTTIIQKRRRNYIRLLAAINEIQGLTPLLPNLTADVCPYLFPVIVRNGSAPVIVQLQKCGIPASSWPDLPEEVLQNQTEHADACWLKQHILLLPIHQDLHDKQLRYIAKCLQKLI